MRVLGLDLSLTATGVAHPDGTLTTLTTPLRGMARLCFLAGHIHVMAKDVDLVALEGYSLGTARQASHAHALGELGGLVRVTLWRDDVPYVDIPPATLKKYSTGKGNSNKDAVLVAAVRRLDVDPADNNQADAAWLRALALDHYGHPLCAMPAPNRGALDAVDWPDLGRSDAKPPAQPDAAA